MVTAGQEFKNYKDLCNYLDEPIKTGEAKVNQLKRWERCFSYHKQGYKIIIDEVYDESLEDNTIKCGHNHKNMDIYLPYIHNCFYNNIESKQSMNKIIVETLHLINEDLMHVTLRNKIAKVDLPKEEAIDFIDWIRKVRTYVAGNVEQSLKILQNNDLIDYYTEYAFISQCKKTSYMAYTSDFNDFIKQSELKVCYVLNDIHKITTKENEKHLKYFIFRNRKYMDNFRKIMLELISNNPALMSALKTSCSEVFHNIDFGSEKYPIEGYWKVWSVMGVKEPDVIDLDAARRAYIDLIIKKTSPKHKIPQKWLKMAFGIDIIKAE